MYWDIALQSVPNYTILYIYMSSLGDLKSNGHILHIGTVLLKKRKDQTNKTQFFPPWKSLFDWHETWQNQKKLFFSENCQKIYVIWYAGRSVQI